MNINPFLLTDAYKIGHHLQYPKGTSLVYSNFTPRSNKYAPEGCNKVVSFGQQMVMEQIHEMFRRDFFKQPKLNIIAEIQAEYKMLIGDDYDTAHIEALHDLGYLPINVKALPEGTLVPIGVPVLTIYNTLPEFYWLTNFLETLISNLLWKPITSATIARQYKKKLLSWALKTDEKAIGFVDFQGHDFSMRGMDSVDATISSGLGHATSFKGSDSLPVIHGARKYYNEEGFVIGSVNATEHSVMSAGGKGNEIETFKKLMETFPTGILSVVSDTWNLWKVITEYLPQLKEEILARDGKLVIRPDSGDPVDIICGTPEDTWVDCVKCIPKQKGVIELLWDIFGGTINEQGYKVLDSHIGAIYGDSITLDRAEAICKRLEAKGFASTNIVLGIGSFTYQYNTRDTFGFAMKATYVEIEEGCTCDKTSGKIGECKTKIVGREIFKDPITDDGVKKSAKGLLHVGLDKITGEYELEDEVNWESIGARADAENTGQLKTIYKDGGFKHYTTLSEIRERIDNDISL